MNLAISYTRSAIGLLARSVSVEVHLTNGLPSFSIVGLPATAIKESTDRVRSAIINSHFEFPCRRITVNLGPADLPKTGSGFDLPIALAILAASGQIPLDKLETHEFIGELTLNGSLRAISSIIPIVIAAQQDNKPLIMASSNAEEAAIAQYDQMFVADNLMEVCNYLCLDTPLQQIQVQTTIQRSDTNLDWSDIKGQQHAKMAMEIAAAGGHSVLLNGPPGSGKTMLAKRFCTLLPLLTEEQALETAAIASIRGKTPNLTYWRQAPFRAPHHTASSIALVGGGAPPKPGEISLAHNGVLFLDELPEFQRHVLETLREPIESGIICISRASMQIEFPARFQLIAAMNPCPCGHYGNQNIPCRCSPDQINRYINKISAPLLDRIDLQINVRNLTTTELLTPHNTTNESQKIRNTVEMVRKLQIERQGIINADLDVKTCEAICELGDNERDFLSHALNKLKLSARAYHRILKVARTIADMKSEQKVTLSELKQALSFKQSLKVTQG